jgi:hypothetical protein
MIIDAVLRAAGILRAQPDHTMPLARLHAQLIAELGADAAGTYGQIYQQLRRQGDSFLLVDTPRFLRGSESWPGAVREAYAGALEAAGMGSCVRVTLTEVSGTAETEELITALHATMSVLAQCAGEDEALREYVAGGMRDVAEITRVLNLVETDHPTIPPRGPRPVI